MYRTLQDSFLRLLLSIALIFITSVRAQESHGMGPITIAPAFTPPVSYSLTRQPNSSASENESSKDLFEKSAHVPTGAVGELQGLLRCPELSELRSTYNGRYGASLLYYGKTLTFYVALSQSNHFWRVMTCTDATRAETIYRAFVSQTARLYDMDSARARVEAQTLLASGMVARSRNRAKGMQADLDQVRELQEAGAIKLGPRHTMGEQLQPQHDNVPVQLQQVQQQIE